MLVLVLVLLLLLLRNLCALCEGVVLLLLVLLRYLCEGVVLLLLLLLLCKGVVVGEGGVGLLLRKGGVVVVVVLLFRSLCEGVVLGVLLLLQLLLRIGVIVVVLLRMHLRGCVSIRQHTSAADRRNCRGGTAPHAPARRGRQASAYVSIRQHT